MSLELYLGADCKERLYGYGEVHVMDEPRRVRQGIFVSNIEVCWVDGIVTDSLMSGW